MRHPLQCRSATGCQSNHTHCCRLGQFARLSMSVPLSHRAAPCHDGLKRPETSPVETLHGGTFPARLLCVC
jgi:hypothetical protein